MNRESPIQALMYAIENRNENRVSELIAANTNVNAIDPQTNRTALFTAVLSNRPNIPTMLLRAGAVVNVKNTDGDTPLMFAAKFGHLDMVQLLLDQGAFHETRNNNNKTAAMLASHRGHAEIATLLESLPARPRGFTLAEEKTIPAIAPKKKPLTFQERLAEIGYEGEIPEEYLCAFSGELINDPIATSSGIIYDRSSLIRYFESKGNPDKLPCPMSMSEDILISKTELTSQPNVYFKNKLNDFVTQKEKEHAAKKKAETVPSAVFPASDLANLRAARMRLFDKEHAPPLYSSARNPSHGKPTHGLKTR